MLLVNIALVVWIVVYNNSYVIVNNIDVWNNQEEVFSNIFNKWNISLESVVKYNSNWEGFLDGISCPQNITMSWSTNRVTGISTTQVYEHGKIYCLWSYNGNDFKIHYDDQVNDFNTAQYEWDLVNIIEASGTNIEVWTTNISLWASVSGTTPWNGNLASHAADGNISTGFDTAYRDWREYIQFQFAWAERSIWKIVIRKTPRTNWWYWNSWNIIFKNSFWTEVHRTSLSNMREDNYHEIDLKYSWLDSNVKSITLETYWYWLDVLEFEVYELNTSWNEWWEWHRTFTDSDNTLITFTKDGIEWNDGIDDDLNSDNYKVTSIWNIYFPNNYQDDDVVPRKTIFWSIPAQKPYQHVYWNNYKTVDVIDKNTNNDDILNVKMWDVNQAHVFINTFNTQELSYDIKILEFDREVYKNQFTLLPLNSYEGKNIDEYLWYIQLDWSDNSLSVAKEKTWNEFEFDFQNKDYAIFIANNSTSLLSYHLEAYTTTWSGIYINPIDDSGSGTISVLANHIIIWWEKNFIWENFEMIGSK